MKTAIFVIAGLTLYGAGFYTAKITTYTQDTNP
jgi:hypothetical protein